MTQSLLLFIDLVRLKESLLNKHITESESVGGFIYHIAHLLRARDERAFFSVRAGRGLLKSERFRVLRPAKG
jgi:hypothetical protein